MQRPQLSVPEPKTASLSYCDVGVKPFRSWVRRLPMANLGELSRQLYHAIIELNQLVTPPAHRLQMLELIRPTIRFACGELSRHYLGMAIALPEKQRKVANLSQALQLHLASGYKLATLEFLDSGPVERNRPSLALACHRSITELGASILRAQQLYGPSPKGSWHESHQLFRFAVAHRLQDTEIEDKTLRHRTGSTVAQAYYRTLLLGGARGNQLRQNELEQIHDLFELWAPSVRCAPELADQAVFLVDMEGDGGPVYRALDSQPPGDRAWGFDTTTLAEEIQEYLHDPASGQPGPGGSASGPLPVPGGVSNRLLVHLGEAFAFLTLRSFNRQASGGQLEVCAGLTAVHYFIAGQSPFNQFVISNAMVSEPQANRFMRSNARDAWSEAFDAGLSEERITATADTPINYHAGSRFSDDAQQKKNQPIAYLTSLVNASPGGYCVAWSASIPAALQAGELLAVREHRTHRWSVAVVRWLRQARGEATRVGVELLAPNASPCGVKLIQKTGNSSEFLRGLLLPEIAEIDQPATLITPNLPFQSGSRIILLHDGTEEQGLLGRRISATGSISQFELRRYNSAADNVAPEPGTGHSGASEDEFDSLWPSL